MKDLVAIDYDHLEAKVEEITWRYHEVCDLKHKYVIRLQDEVEKKEEAKQQHFQSSKLNIKLQKFKGYESSVDLYTFKSDFEKLHQKTTPSALLLDLLKNNFLEGPALTLVKGVGLHWRDLGMSEGTIWRFQATVIEEAIPTQPIWKNENVRSRKDCWFLKQDR